MSTKQTILLAANKVVMKTPFLSFSHKVKIRKIIMNELKATGFKGL